ncbi:MAG TPA: methyltransferase domain-containing protein [Actinomycetota bacterium]|nr:methyltransferase domain-containing protein [Actinomycetota bacterium]
MDFFALTQPGIGPVLRREAESLPLRDLSVDADVGFDGRADVVAFCGRTGPALLGLRTAEAVLVQVGTSGPGAAAKVAATMWEPRRAANALSVFAGLGGALRPRMGFRVAVRVLSETNFRRTDLRRAVAQVVGSTYPRWGLEDPAALELWVVESSPGRFRLGLRLDKLSRTGPARDLERVGALRPSVAAAMVLLAGRPKGWMLDAFCGSGTILAAGADAEWEIAGCDLDPAALLAAAGNLGPRPRLLRADALKLPLAGGRFSAAVSNLPFGKRFPLPPNPGRWFGGVMEELCRVTVPGAKIVLLGPRGRGLEAAVAQSRRVEELERFDVTVLGEPARIFVLGPGLRR